ncbi:MAG: hypothetical protein IPK02_01030 [Candidatus Accumulibacter sp.]|uniref:Uncharacterized protein n=1 Tax=Candidatus Accumulibacter affinis TaxID=2954384 RepID=A0A935W345_9PROT|nr:hypothetical protein [Candidatus Accumulibacter affinis]
MRMTVLSTALASWLWANFVYAYDLTVSAAAENQVISGSKSYTVPQGTASVALLYNVYSAEYPYYVTAQSVFNDVWSLSLTGSNGSLYDISRQVNSQLTQAPTWLANSTTGDIRQTINVSGLTVAGPVTLQIIATAMNVGDSALPTVVGASLEQAPQLTIDAANPDIINTNNNGTFYSIPAIGDTNTMQRYFTLELSKGDAITVKNVTVTLQGSGDLMEVVHQLPIPSGNDVQVLAQSATSMSLKVRATVLNPASTVNDNPPPTRDIAYKFRIVGEDNTGNPVSAEKTVTGRRSLWRMVNLLPGRYGIRDVGHDDWGARGTYNWLSQNASLINDVDDISGEHGKNIGHNTHQYGTDIDTYHFYRFSGATSGTDNYNKLSNAAVTAFGTLLANGTPNPTPPAAALDAVNNLKSFVSATRDGLKKLADLGTVSALYYSIGSAGSGLSNGWAKALIETGKVTKTTNNVPLTLDLGVGSWSNAKVSYNSVHNNHVHVTLNRPAIGE